MSLKLTASKEELREAFFALQTRQDIARLLDVPDKQLVYHLYIESPHRRYAAFQIPKKTGGTRDILAPVSGLKIIQQKLNQALQAVYDPKPSVHGFVEGRNIVSNARLHARQRHIFNIDLRNFFPTINFGRVRGLFMAQPYNRNDAVATVLAQICCFNNQLPQGAPTSPVVSNMLCAKMDTQLQRLARKYRCTYTRYADDLTFSTPRLQFPKPIMTMSGETGPAEVGDELASIIRSNGFEINEKKVRLLGRGRRQEVTGLVTNRFPNVPRRYVREIRAILHALETYGLDATEDTYRKNFAPKHLGPRRQQPSFKKVIDGRIEFLGMVRGKSDPMYLRFREKLGNLIPELARERPPEPVALPVPRVMTEGKTDWKHFDTALIRLKQKGLFQDLEINFHQPGADSPSGDDALLKSCKSLAEVAQGQPVIYVFDRDNPKVLNQIAGGPNWYKDWGNNVFSFAIPIPEHRPDTEQVCVELLYQDKDIKRPDPNGRRLFLSNEFQKDSGKHLDLQDINCTNRNKFSKPGLSIIDDQVWDKSHQNIALPKDDFATLITNEDEAFREVDFTAFGKVFEIITAILKNAA